ncbi:hypothetical protein EUX98_g556 [Antrodiella citrinella]|uniref:RlpA-like protein double-psi beta-barrel domain-containing protein n=1 Tax=Antrodiella citrinella TaxID=2447956 RepID=A0A4S4N6S4_9APHY|nr:hypothetical protein EUX98_g556 [Antrodiella citrinella]
MPLSLLVSLVFVLVYLLLGTEASDLRAAHNTLESRYARAHSLSNNYHFSARDGWQTVNVTNLQYKYRRDFVDEDDDVDDDEPQGAVSDDDVVEEEFFELAKRANKNITFNPPTRRANRKTVAKSKAKSTKSPKKGGSNKSSKKPSTKNSPKSSSKAASKDTSKSALSKGGLTASVKNILASLKGEGSAEPVTITWYTGHDLENPSCWPNPVWAPTDASFACALTLEGWVTRPKCFKFLELCNTPKKCVFVRVVDSCAGCKKGSKHVDLTQAAFKELATLDEGLLQVQMRQATEPEGWLEHLWGPKD